MTPEFWLNLQSYYELEIAKDLAAERINLEVVPMVREDVAEYKTSED